MAARAGRPGRASPPAVALRCAGHQGRRGGQETARCTGGAQTRGGPDRATARNRAAERCRSEGRRAPADVRGNRRSSRRHHAGRQSAVRARVEDAQRYRPRLKSRQGRRGHQGLSKSVGGYGLLPLCRPEVSDSGRGVRSQGEGQPTSVLSRSQEVMGDAPVRQGLLHVRSRRPIATVIFSEVPNEASWPWVCAISGTATSRAGPRCWGLVTTQVMHAVFGNVRVADRTCHLGRGQRANEGRALYAGSGRSTCRWPGSRRSPR